MTRAIQLSPIDHVFTGAAAYPLEFVFACGGTIDPDGLRASLQRVLESFPPFSSRLARRDDRYLLVPSRDVCGLDVRVCAPPGLAASREAGAGVLVGCAE